MADIDAKAQALSAARNRILQLQEQMTDKVLQMAAEVEKLMDVVPVSEAKAFLKARCNLPAVELSTYVGFAKTLKGSEDVLRVARVSFPVLKALVSADPAARREILERMEIGAKLDTKDVASIRRRLAAAKLTAAEALTAENKRIVAAAARKQAKEAVSRFGTKMSAFVEELRLHFRKGQAVRERPIARLPHLNADFDPGRCLVSMNSLHRTALLFRFRSIHVTNDYCQQLRPGGPSGL
ncbi:hypothetical protein [Rhizobium leguminosarum]|uniref:hypothetical protein n=1 Tax=Rhizobium leguminosarum TaxID=384 RepID=UPI00104008A8|nr:hypothetical protein [Rhizobium leguminosarum]TBZ45180.1 hypothetical protein E0H44_17240 [Rhizobium leguminosarum bv. viciae]